MVPVGQGGVCGKDSETIAQNLWRLDMTVLVKSPRNQKVLAEAAPFTEEYPIPENGVRYSYCSEHQCYPPLSSAEELNRLFL